jgi:hypothetical protein
MPLNELEAIEEVGAIIIYGAGKKVCNSSDLRKRIERMRNDYYKHQT